MAQGMRPGGLTALAVVNFVLSGLGFLGAIGLVLAMTVLAGELDDGQAAGSGTNYEDEEAHGSEAKSASERREEEDPSVAANRAQMRLLRENKGKVIVQAGLALLEAILLLLSGIGYLGQKRFMGRYLGTACAVLSLGALAFQLTYLPFGIEHMQNVIYPLLTLLLLNTTFRHDFVN